MENNCRILYCGENIFANVFLSHCGLNYHYRNLKEYSMSVIVNMACGLANRMFQYSYYLFLKHKGYNVKVDFYNSAKLAHERFHGMVFFQKLKSSRQSFFDVLKSGAGLICSQKFVGNIYRFFQVSLICLLHLTQICQMRIKATIYNRCISKC